MQLPAALWGLAAVATLALNASALQIAPSAPQVADDHAKPSVADDHAKPSVRQDHAKAAVPLAAADGPKDDHAKPAAPPVATDHARPTLRLAAGDDSKDDHAKPAAPSAAGDHSKPAAPSAASDHAKATLSLAAARAAPSADHAKPAVGDDHATAPSVADDHSKAALPVAAGAGAKKGDHAELPVPAKDDHAKLPGVPAGHGDGHAEAAPRPVTAADVAKLHTRLEAVAAGLEGMLRAESKASLAGAKVAPALRAFVTELRAALNATAAPKDIPAAFKRLRDAQAGVGDLTKALTVQQATLMREDEDEEASLLMGVLMVRRAKPMEEQLEVLRSHEFAGLPVSKVLLARHDDKVPLFQQVAAYMDEHGAKNGTSSRNERADQLAKTVSYFEKRVAALEEEGARMKRMHDESSSRLTQMINKSSKEEAHKLRLMKKQADREYRKRTAAHKMQRKMLQDVVDALKRGDLPALKKAQDALKASVKAMKQNTGNFLHFIQLGHRLSHRDCPYCAAQCIDKCHSGGGSYSQCLTSCADAGK